MSQWINTTPEQRIKQWKTFRESLESLPLEKQCDSVADFFSTMPIGARTIDYYTPESWPTPWEILYNKTYCKNTISILMYDTLQIINNTPRIELQLINDEQDTYLVPVIDNNIVLNHILGEVSKLDEFNSLYQITVLDRFQNIIRKY